MYKKYIIGSCIFLFLIFGAGIYYFLFSAPNHAGGQTQFVITVGESQNNILAQLYHVGLIRNTFGFGLVLHEEKLSGKFIAGGYILPLGANAWQVATVFSHGPSLLWVTIPEGLRKEEIGSILQNNFGWTNAQLTEWTNVDTVTPADYFEGVYFPDTYLLPASTTPADAAKYLQTQFQEFFAQDAQEALTQNIKWTTLLKIASLVQREAAGKSDMPIIAGIVWNRLLQNMRLQIDSTVQYARGNTGNGWWAPVTAADIKNIDSPYNTYEHKGLPPTPIDNPGLDAIDAVLHPASTTCLYYLHDTSEQIHCSDTFEEHQMNVQKYL